LEKVTAAALLAVHEEKLYPLPADALKLTLEPESTH
jgi:hypothetical protein